MSTRSVLELLRSEMDEIDQMINWTRKRQSAHDGSKLGREQKELLSSTEAELSLVRGYLKESVNSLARYEREEFREGAPGPSCPR